MDGSSSAFLKTFASFLLENVKKKKKDQNLFIHMTLFLCNY